MDFAAPTPTDTSAPPTAPPAAPPAGWYPDPALPGQQRYWDGAAWTPHTAVTGPAQPIPAAPRKRMSGGAIAGIVVAAVVVGIFLLGLLAAITIPLYLSQQQDAQDAAAQDDLEAIAMAVSDEWAANPAGPGAIREEGDTYTMRANATTTVIADRSPDTHLDGYYLYEDWNWCVAVVSGSGAMFSVDTYDWTVYPEGCPQG